MEFAKKLCYKQLVTRQWSNFLHLQPRRGESGIRRIRGDGGVVHVLLRDVLKHLEAMGRRRQVALLRRRRFYGGQHATGEALRSRHPVALLVAGVHEVRVRRQRVQDGAMLLVFRRRRLDILTAQIGQLTELPLLFLLRRF